MLSVIQRAISDRRNNFSDDEERVAIEIIGRAAGHDRASTQMERSHDDSKKRPAPFVDAKSEGNA